MDLIIRILGTIVWYTLLAGAVIVLAELVWYRLPSRKGAGRHASRRIALVTGATSGLGRAYAQLIDQKARGIDEIWLIGRRKERLQAVSAGLKHASRCLPYDLTEAASLRELENLLRAENAQAGYLINCAGFAKIGRTDAVSAADEKGMIDLNCTAAAALCAVCLPFMEQGDHIVNVCSTAAFQPFQRLNVYAASKAFLLRYTRALRAELLPKKIMVTAVCPYWIKDTEFIGIAEKEKGADIRSYPLASKVSSVATVSFLGIRIGVAVTTPGIVCTVHRLFSKLLPDTVLACIWEGLRRI